MIGRNPWDAFSTSGDTARRIDAVCDRFERAWRQGENPRLESCLLDVEETHRSLLLRALLEVEVELVASSGGQPDLETYLERFPQYASVIRDLMETANVSGAPTPIDAGPPPLNHPKVLGDYEVLEPLGSGGMGQVYRARHRHMDRVVALKVMHPAGSSSPADATRFRQEIKTIARLAHPNTVTAYDAGFHDGVPFLVTEYIDGITLDRLVRTEGPLDVPRAVEFIRQAALALEYAHSQGIVHRDVKPSNLIVQRDGTVKLLDLGLAKFRAWPADVQDAGPITQSGMLMGTPDYMAPEQSLDVRSVDHRADIYGLGCTLFFLLTGRPPYQAETLLQKLLAHRDQPVPFLRAVRSDVPESVESLVWRMLAKRPEDRVESMTALLTELGETLAAEGQPGRNGSPASPLGHDRGGRAVAVLAGGRKRTRWRLLAAIVLPIALAAAALALLFGPQEPPPASSRASILPASEAETPEQPRYIWSDISEVYHDPDCWAVRRISAHHRHEGMLPPEGKRKHDCRPGSTQN